MKPISLFLAVVGVLILTPPASAQRFSAIHGAKDVEYQAWVDGLNKDGYRPTHVSGCTVDGTTLFAAIAIDDGKQLDWEARRHLTADQYQLEFVKWTGKGYQPISITGYPHKGSTHYAAIWVKGAFDGPCEARHDLTSDQFEAAMPELNKRGLRPWFVTGYPVGNTHQMAAIWVKAKIPAWRSLINLSADQCQEEIDLAVKQGMYPVSLAGYLSGNSAVFAVLFVRHANNPLWEVRLGLTEAQYQQEFDKWTAQGYQPTVVSGYLSQGQLRYAGVWTKSVASLVKDPLPVSGQAVPELAAFDDAMQKFMRERSISGGALAVTKNGKIVLAHGYGYQDSLQGKLLGPDTPFRLASLSKPITLALVLKLVREGKLTRNTKIVEYLNIAPAVGQEMDPRWKDITVKHLIDHRGGWDRDKVKDDPMFQPLKIAKALGKPGPATAQDIIQYMAGQPLQSAPGTKTAYSNFGYCLLGRVIEKATGLSYMAALQKDILQPLGLDSIELGRSLPTLRNPKEPQYLDPGLMANVMQPKSTIQVPSPDGGFHLEAMDAHGGLIGSAPDLVRFMNAYWINGQPRKEEDGTMGTFFGSLPGTWTMIKQRRDGVNIAVLFNQRRDPSGLDYSAIQQVLDQAADKIKTWPRK